MMAYSGQCGSICFGKIMKWQGIIDEKIWDVICYAVALADCCGIDLKAEIQKRQKELTDLIKSS